MTIGKKLYELREKKGISTTTLADRLNLDTEEILDWENDKAVPDLITAKQLADLLDVTLNDLFDTTDSCTSKYDSSFSLDFFSGTKLMLCGALLIFFSHIFTSASILFIIGLLLFIVGLFRK